MEEGELKDGALSAAEEGTPVPETAEEPAAGEGAPPEGEPSPADADETLYRAVMNNGSVRARVLADYLESLRGVPLMGGTGKSVSAPPLRPKTIAEAGALALGYLKRNH